MSSRHIVTPKNLPLVWLRLTVYVVETLREPEALKAFCNDLNNFLNTLLNDDAFGTEGQCDPRGDQRD